MMRLLSLLLIVLCAMPAGAQRIIAFGDMPYRAEDAAAFAALTAQIDALAPGLVIHLGDTKAADTPCDDATLARQRDVLEAFAAPTLYTPGDNEWTDCHTQGAGGYDPLERLAHLRATYFSDPARSFGAAPLAVRHQGAAGYPENVRLLLGAVMVMTVHVVGSNNGLRATQPGVAAEMFARDAANRAWLAQGFAAARAADAQAVIVALHADMFGPGSGLPGSGYGPFAEALRAEASAWGLPVLLIYGDSHRLQLHRPYPRAAPNLLALQSFGGRHLHAVEITFTPGTAGRAPQGFSVRPVFNALSR